MGKKANIFESFSHSAIQQFKEAFGIMDTNKDGLLSSDDLVAAFAAHGKQIGGGEAQVSTGKQRKLFRIGYNQSLKIRKLSPQKAEAFICLYR